MALSAYAPAAQETSDDLGELESQWLALIDRAQNEDVFNELIERAWALERVPGFGTGFLDLISLWESTYDALPEDSILRPYALENFVDALQSENQSARAHEVLDREQELFLQHEATIGAFSHEVVIPYLRARVFLREGLTEKALTLAEDAVEKSRSLRDDPYRSAFHQHAIQVLADALLSSGRYERLLRLLESFRDPQVESDPALALAEGMAHLELSQESRDHLPLARKAFKAVVDSESADPYHRSIALGRLALIAMEAGQLEESRGLLARALEAKAPSTAERAFQLALVCQMAPESGPQKVQSQNELIDCCEDLFGEWEGLGQPPGGLGYLRYQRERIALVEFIEAVADRDGLETAFLEWNRVQSFSTLCLDLGRPRVSMDETLAELTPHDGGLVTFAFGRSSLLLFVVTHTNGLELIVHDAGSGLLAACAAYQNEIARPPPPGESRADRLLAEGQALAERIYPPKLRERLALGGDWVFVGADAFAGLPIESLPVFSERPLSLDLAIWHLPSIPVGLGILRNSSSVEPPGLDVLFVSDPVLTEEKPGASSPSAPIDPIKLGQNRSLELVDSFPETRRRVLRGSDATLDGLELALEEHPALIHLFAHGASSPGESSATGILLSGAGMADALLTIDKVLALRWPSTVVLSACGSARGPERSGDWGASDLRGAFLRRGTRCVVSTRVNVQQAATYRLMKVAMREIATGKDVAEALRCARQELVENLEMRDPYYFAQFQVMGPPMQAQFHYEPMKSHWRWIWMLLILPAAWLGRVGWKRTRRRSPRDHREGEAWEA